LSFHFVNKNLCVIYFPLCLFLLTLYAQTCRFIYKSNFNFHFLTGIPLFRSVSRRLYTVSSQKIRFPASHPDDVSYCLDAYLSNASSVWTTWIPVRTFLYVKKLRNALACIRPDDSAACPDDSQCSIKP
jgi:hypothetical protein